VLLVYPSARVLRAAERAEEDAKTNPAGYFLRLVKDGSLTPSRAETERVRLATEALSRTVKEEREREQRRKLDQDNAALDADLARFEAEVWGKLTPAEQEEIDHRVASSNAFLAKLGRASPAFRLARIPFVARVCPSPPDNNQEGVRK
jgi:hypothetical protein